MSKIQEIKAVQLVARKNREALKSTLLTTLIGEAEMIGKSDGNRETTDDEVMALLKKFEKGMVETLGYLAKGTDNETAIGVVNAELEIIRQFMPQKLTDDEVRGMIGWIIGTQSLPLEQKSLGVITKMMKEKYGDQFDGRQVSTVFKGML